MKRLKPLNYYYTLSTAHQPPLRILAGETVIVGTADAFLGKIKTESDPPTPDRVPYSEVNPQSGPIYTGGAEKGHTGCRHTRHSRNLSHGITATVPNFRELTRINFKRLLNDPLPAKTEICAMLRLWRSELAEKS